jgi:hypothetical protein
MADGFQKQLDEIKQKQNQPQKDIFDLGFDRHLNRIDPQRERMEQQAIDASERRLQRDLETKRHKETLKLQRILGTKEDKRVHAINKIIERAEGINGEVKNFSIDYYDFNYEDSHEVLIHEFTPFLEKLKLGDCFTGFDRQTGINQVHFNFQGVNVDNLKKYREKILPIKENSIEEIKKQAYIKALSEPAPDTIGQPTRNNASAKEILTYNEETGDGKLRGIATKRLKDGTREKKIFDEVFKNRGHKITREKVMQLLGLESQKKNNTINPRELFSAVGDKPKYRKDNKQIQITNKINEVVKGIRKKMGLNTSELVNNNGNITLAI